MRLTFPVAVLLTSTIALIWPEHFISLKSWIVPLLSVCMFSMGITLKVEDFRMILKKPVIVGIGLAAQFIVMSTTAYVIVTLLNLPPEIAIGVIMVGTCPGGVSSNVMTFLARGDLALSVALTACSTLLAPLLTPALTLLFAGQSIEVDAIAMFLSILQIVIVPVCIGMLLHKTLDRLTAKAASVMPTISMLAILIIIAIIVALNAQNIYQIAGVTILAVILHNLCGMAFGYGIGKIMRFSPAQRRTLSLEIGLQNSGLAASLCKVHFAAYPTAMLPAAFFSIWHNLSGSIAASIWSRRSAHEKQERE